MVNKALNSTHLPSAQWFSGEILSKQLTRPAVRQLLETVEGGKGSWEYLARQILVAELCSRSGIRKNEIQRLDSACDKIATSNQASRWPRFVARVLRTGLPELNGFLTGVCDWSMSVGESECWNEVAPPELCVVLRGDEPSPRKQYNLTPKGKEGSKFMSVLQNEKGTGTNKDSPIKSTPRLSLPTTGSDISRRVGRSNRTTAMSSPSAFQGNGLVALGRSTSNRGNSNGSTAANARAAMERIQLGQQQRTVEVLANDELPPADDTLRARQNKLEERRKQRQQQEEARRVRAQERRKREAEKLREQREKRLARREEYLQQREEDRNNRMAEGDESDIEANNVEVVELDFDADDQEDPDYANPTSTATASKRVTASARAGRASSPAQKRVRVPRRFAPRTQASSGEEAWRSRARRSGRSAILTEFESSLRGGPEYVADADLVSASARPVAATMQSQAVFEPGQQPKEPDESDETDVFKRAVGEYRKNLSVRDAALIRRFVNHGVDGAEGVNSEWLFHGQDKREFVLDENEDNSLILRLTPDAKWQRVRYNLV